MKYTNLLWIVLMALVCFKTMGGMRVHNIIFDGMPVFYNEGILKMEEAVCFHVYVTAPGDTYWSEFNTLKKRFCQNKPCNYCDATGTCKIEGWENPVILPDFDCWELTALARRIYDYNNYITCIRQSIAIKTQKTNLSFEDLIAQSPDFSGNDILNLLTRVYEISNEYCQIYTDRYESYKQKIQSKCHILDQFSGCHTI